MVGDQHPVDPICASGCGPQVRWQVEPPGRVQDLRLDPGQHPELMFSVQLIGSTGVDGWLADRSGDRGEELRYPGGRLADVWSTSRSWVSPIARAAAMFSMRVLSASSENVECT